MNHRDSGGKLLPYYDYCALSKLVKCHQSFKAKSYEWGQLLIIFKLLGKHHKCQKSATAKKTKLYRNKIRLQDCKHLWSVENCQNNVWNLIAIKFRDESKTYFCTMISIEGGVTIQTRSEQKNEKCDVNKYAWILYGTLCSNKEVINANEPKISLFLQTIADSLNSKHKPFFCAAGGKDHPQVCNVTGKKYESSSLTQKYIFWSHLSSMFAEPWKHILLLRCP